MSEQHTPEPWEVSAFGDGLHAHNIPICQFFNKCEDDYPNREANARRIVACVNACAGIPTDDLERASNELTPVFELLMQATKERDELLAALDLWLDIHDKPAGFVGKYGKSLTDAIAAQEVKVNAAAAAARAAIANVKGGAA